MELISKKIRVNVVLKPEEAKAFIQDILESGATNINQNAIQYGICSFDIDGKAVEKIKESPVVEEINVNS